MPVTWVIRTKWWLNPIWKGRYLGSAWGMSGLFYGHHSMLDVGSRVLRMQDLSHNKQHLPWHNHIWRAQQVLCRRRCFAGNSGPPSPKRVYQDSGWTKPLCAYFTNWQIWDSKCPATVKKYKRNFAGSITIFKLRKNV